MQNDNFAQADQLANQLQDVLKQLPDRLMQGGAGVTNIGNSLMGWAPWIVMAWVAYFVLRRGFTPTLLLESFSIHRDPGTGGALLRIAGRRSGPVGRVFSFLGLDPLVAFVVTKSMVRLESSGLFGKTTKAVAWRSVSSIYYGSAAATPLAIAGGAIVIAGMIMWSSLAGKAGIVVGLVLIGFGLFRQRYLISVATSGNVELAIGFRGGLLGGESFDQDRMNEAGRLLEKLLQRKDDAATPRVAEPEYHKETIPLAREPIASRPRELDTGDVELEPESAPSLAPRPPARTPALELNEPASQTPTQVTGSPHESVFVPSRRNPAMAPRPIPAPQVEAAPLITKKPRPRPVSQTTPQNVKSSQSAEDQLAEEAFQAAVRVFESGRPSEAEAAWWAIIRRWPDSPWAKRARKVLSGRRGRARRKEPPTSRA